MNEEPKSIWKKPLRLPQLVWAWLALMVATILIYVIIMVVINEPFGLLMILLNSAVGTAIILAGWIFIRWLCCWRNLKRALFALACLATLIALFYAEENWRGKHTWDQFRQEWDAKGIHFDWASVVPAPVPDDQNFALTPIVASCYEWYFDTNGQVSNPRNTNVVDRLSMMNWRDDSYENKREKVPESPSWLEATEMNLQAWQNFFRALPPPNSQFTNCYPVAPAPQTPAADVLLALSKYRSAIEEIRQASRLPYSRFPLTYNAEPKFGILLPHLAALKTSARAISLRAVAELQNSQPEPAGEDALLGLFLAQSLHTEPCVISQLVRMSILETALQPVWEGLENHQWSESQLTALDADLARADFLADFQRVQLATIGFATEDLSYLRHHRDLDAVFAPIGVNYPGDLRNAFFLIHRFAPGGWFYQSALRNARVLLQYLPAVDGDAKIISPKLSRQADELAATEARCFDPLNSMKKVFNDDLLSSGNFVKKIARAQSYINLARTAIALERYRLTHGEFPATLDALTPQFIAQVPHDVIGGQPLKYRREADGRFTLYSIGWNETDDGGVVVFKKKSEAADINAGDWVWRYP